MLTLLKKERRAVAVLAILVVGAVIFVAFSLNRPQPPAFVPTPQASSGETGWLRMTVDASAENEWRYLDLNSGALVDSTASWDVALQRFHVRLPDGRSLEKWYSYSFTSHLLTPKEKSYDVATRNGRARLRILSYYCPGPKPGCLTLEWQTRPLP